MTNVKRQNTCDRDKVLVLKGILKELRYQAPALATLIYADWLPQVNGPPGVLPSKSVDHQSVPT